MGLLNKFFKKNEEADAASIEAVPEDIPGQMDFFEELGVEASAEKQETSPANEALEEDDKEAPEEESAGEADEDKYIHEVDAVSREHAAVLERLAKKCYSNKTQGFTEVEKLEAVYEELKDTEYKEYRDNHYSLYVRGGLESLSPEKPLYIVSSHADNVSAITAPFSELTENKYYLRGTYDNLGTNAACVIMMKEEQLPENVVFLFTANEENGKCTGLKHAVDTFRKNGYEDIYGIALDVTYEGHGDGLLYSIENANGKDFINALCEKAMDLEPLMNGQPAQSFSFTMLKDKSKYAPDKDILPKEYISSETGWFDEGFAFKDLEIPACSICLPCMGEMHGNSGCVVRQPTYEGYVMSLTSILYELTQTHKTLTEAYKTARGTCLEQNAAIMIEEEKYRAKKREEQKQNHASTGGFYGGNGYYGYHSLGDYYANHWRDSEEYDETVDYYGNDDADLDLEWELCDAAAEAYVPDDYYSYKEIRKMFINDAYENYSETLMNNFGYTEEEAREYLGDIYDSVWREGDEYEDEEDGKYYDPDKISIPPLEMKEISHLAIAPSYSEDNYKSYKEARKAYAKEIYENYGREFFEEAGFGGKKAAKQYLSDLYDERNKDMEHDSIEREDAGYDDGSSINDDFDY